MNVFINNQKKEFLNTVCLSDLLKENSNNQNGIAIAVNEKVIPKSQWENFQLKENDSILIIKATQGG